MGLGGVAAVCIINRQENWSGIRRIKHTRLK